MGCTGCGKRAAKLVANAGHVVKSAAKVNLLAVLPAKPKVVKVKKFRHTIVIK